MRATKALSIKIPPTLLEETERIARRQRRSTSALVREALERYVWDRNWQQMRRYGRAKVKKLGLTEADVERLIHESRRERRAEEQMQA
jgi:metal-responsive CopG/Arc/MetJ family transcriptional regulator